MSIFRYIIRLMLCVVVSTATVNAAEWQWSTQIQSFVSAENNDFPRAFLWIPPTCKHVRAVVVGNHNMLEEGILEHTAFRKQMAKLGIAEIWITPGLSQNWEPDKENSQMAFDEMINSLAEISGYSELKYAPIIPVGHSAMATFPWNFAAQNNDRTLAVLSIHGDAPATNLTGYGRTNIDWTNLKIDGIPGLMVVGEYEWWEARVQPALDYKKQNPNACVSFLCDAGHGHFDYSEQLVDYLCLFIEKAVKYRLPKQVNKNKPVELIPVNPQNGWLADRWHKDTIPNAASAKYGDFTGNKANAFWYFDKEMAQKTEQIYERQRGKKTQYLGYSLKNLLIPFNSKHFYGYLPEFKPDSDGVTFYLSPAFTDSLRLNKSEKHARYPSKISRICGPVYQVNDTTFQVQYYRMGMNNPKRTADICMMLANDGDKSYKSAVQQCLIKILYRNNEGVSQRISFDSILDVRFGTKDIYLNAVSTSGLKVYFYVQEGPAEIVGNKLVFNKIPPRAKFPVKVVVVAWQYGRSTEPKVQTAQAVTQMFRIVK